MSAPGVRVARQGPVVTVILDRPSARNAVDRDTADALLAAFEAFAADDTAHVAVLTGAGDTFCAGADLKAIAAGRPNRLAPDGPAPMGPTRLALDKPVIAAIAGHAVAGGLELALWCDLRVVEADAVLGVFCRRWGVPLIDGGTERLPQLIGLSRALDLVLTGRPAGADEALAMGLANRVVAPGTARAEAEALAHTLAALPQVCLRSDRRACYAAFDQPLAAAMRAAFVAGTAALDAEGVGGAGRFAAGAGRHGAPAPVAAADALSDPQEARCRTP